MSALAERPRERLTRPDHYCFGARFRRQALAPKGATLRALGLDRACIMPFLDLIDHGRTVDV